MSGEITCEVDINGTPVADDGASYQAGLPTVLSGLTVEWGRDSVTDQPQTSTLSCTLAESQGGSGALDLVRVGYPVDIYAHTQLPVAGDPTNTFYDGSFEDIALAIEERVTQGVTHPQAVVYQTAFFHSGTRALRITNVEANGVQPSQGEQPRMGPKPFSTDIHAWDDVASFLTGETWTIKFWHLEYNPFVETPVLVAPAVFSGPLTDSEWRYAEGTAYHIPNGPVKTWVQYSFDVTGSGAPGWLGAAIWAGGNMGWDDLTAADAVTSWEGMTDQAVPWSQLDAIAVDDVEIWAPPVARTTSLVFSGRITDLSIEAAPKGAQCTLTASDTTADMANDNIGDVPWAAQTIQSRIDKIAAVATVPFTYAYPLSYGNFQVTYLDVDNQPVMGLLSDLAISADLVLWSAFHIAKGGFYLWFEDPMERAALGVLVVDADTGKVVVDYSGDYRPANAVVISACDIPRDDPAFNQSVADIVSRVDATWQEQILNAGVVEPTERYVHRSDTSLESKYGIRRVSLSTQLTSAADCTTVADRVLVRSQDLNWTVEGVAWDTARVDLIAGGARLAGNLATSPQVKRWCAVGEFGAAPYAGAANATYTLESEALADGTTRYYGHSVSTATPTAPVLGFRTNPNAQTSPATMLDGGGVPLPAGAINIRVSYWFRVNMVGIIPTMINTKIRFADASLNWLGGVLNTQTPIVASGQWVQVDITRAITAGAAFALIMFDTNVVVANIAAGDGADIADIFITTDDYSGAYFDGDSPNAEWNGDPNLSASTLFSEQQEGATNKDYATRLLDGVTRCGLPVTITDLPDWAPSAPNVNYYLEGGTYTYEAGYWRLDLNLSPSQTTGHSAIWTDLDPSWSWAMFDRSVAWSDLWGVGVTGSSAIWERLTANIIERQMEGMPNAKHNARV